MYKLDPLMLEPLHAIPAAGTLLSLAVLILAPFFKTALMLLYIGVLLWILLNLYVVLDARSMYKSYKPALLVPLVMPAQIYGYGSGFIYNYIRRIWFGKGQKVGFKKNYYK